MRPLLLRNKMAWFAQGSMFLRRFRWMGEGYIGNFQGLHRCTFMNANGLRTYRTRIFLGHEVLRSMSQ
jgi:hypothetical protein